MAFILSALASSLKVKLGYTIVRSEAQLKA